ncbi:uncharacterized protein N7498_008927 [Penicillium cinerascens]|uniref:Uncharacterized protein n=1 Tax=Penicillium cinerascens TaxID=70096 RepID=A0A9W9MB97_9EURO|nr:uncharacterized protein N7498_008927 [Penicillium cinerascens]KAJ5195489.1 hypothetical protein N7498_008927 [Penicillium cinerascens]
MKPLHREYDVPAKIVAANELSTTLKDVFDLAVFSQLLEMDEEEDRKISSTSLYGFIESGEEKVDTMDHALSQYEAI